MQNDEIKNVSTHGSNTMLATVAQEFIAWRDKLYKEVRGGKLMFDAPKHYKWLDEDELFTYYTDIGRGKTIN